MKMLRAIRMQRSMTQKQLADDIGVTQSNVAMWESGAAMPSAAKLPELADALHCSIDELYGRTPPEAAS